MKRYAILLLLTFALVGCDRYGPLVNVDRPDTVRAYQAGSKAVITDQASLERIMIFFAAPGRSWRRYWITTPTPEASATLEKNGRPVASVMVGRDWAIASIIGGAPESYSTQLEKGDHDELLRLLHLSGGQPNAVTLP